MQLHLPSSLITAAACLVLGHTAAADDGQGTAQHATPPTPNPIPVGVVRSDAGWSLVRDGRPYRIKGAGGPGTLQKLAAAGANSTRVWGIDQLEDGRLDEAHRHGVTVAVGIWLRHDLDYDDPAQVAAQIDRAIAGVEQYKNHPAVLLWGVGNEMEVAAGDNPAVWHHVESIAAKIKQTDPHHPTMTVVAEIGGDKVRQIHTLCPNIDIVGINAYGGAPSIPQRYRDAGGTKPYILTEFGPRGPWDLKKNTIGSLDEELGKVKSATYAESYHAVMADRELCLGSYAFKWGSKQEATPTWFGMFLPDGRKTPAVDAMTKAWSGHWPDDRSPQVDSLQLVGGQTHQPGAKVVAKLHARDPEKQPLTVGWSLMQDAGQYLTAGYFQETPPTLTDNLLDSSLDQATFRAPEQPGLYRIYSVISDGQGGADVANAVFRVPEPEQ